MTDDTAAEAAPPPAAGIGEQLRAAREGLGLSVAQVSQQTRIAQRHLTALEQGDYASLPGRTYALGFTRTYARAVGLDPAEAAAAVRRDLYLDVAERPAHPAGFEPGDPARVPSATLGWISALAVVALLIAGYFLLPRLFAPAAQLPSLFEQQEREQAAAAASQAAVRAQEAASPATAAGPVVFTALEDGIWVKFYDASGRQLMQKLMAKGETWTVPEDAEGPQLWTGRPEALAITVGGRAVPPIDTQQRTVRDVQVSRAALLARPTAEEPVAPATGPTPAPATR